VGEEVMTLALLSGKKGAVSFSASSVLLSEDFQAASLAQKYRCRNADRQE
jgi:hypothetical protein